MVSEYMRIYKFKAYLGDGRIADCLWTYDYKYFPSSLGKLLAKVEANTSIRSYKFVKNEIMIKGKPRQNEQWLADDRIPPELTSILTSARSFAC